MFLGFLESRIDNPEDWDTLLDAKNIGRDTIFTLLMRRTDSDNSNATSRRILFNVLTRYQFDQRSQTLGLQFLKYITIGLFFQLF